jgi:hypothetical protein
MVPEAPLEQTEHGLVAAGEGWFVLNAREARWFKREGQGVVPALQRQWDFVHCPAGTQHVIVGAGELPCTVFAVGALEHHTTGARVDGTLQGTVDWGAYTVDEAALRHGAGVEEETTDAEVAYARFPEPEPTRYRDGWLPG